MRRAVLGAVVPAAALVPSARGQVLLGGHAENEPTAGARTLQAYPGRLP